MIKKILYAIILILLLAGNFILAKATQIPGQGSVQIQSFVPELLKQISRINVNFYKDKQWYEYKSIDFTTEVENIGDVPVVPTGYIEIYNPYGKKIETDVVNETNITVEPGKTVNFDNHTIINSKIGLVGIGKYNATLTLFYGDNEISKNLSYLVIPWRLALIIIFNVSIIFSFVIFCPNYLIPLYYSKKKKDEHKNRAHK